ncbi:premelanosome protein b [Denticeps clupeoides]|uniref:PKD domain-containing protein n=1 Tax=Denticeps clupeoides TaxID=299321 RepID=A0AAY4EGV9_9TELE|nr:melanocyte protein PMEL-like [Denticeps clupeoides]
MKNFSVALILAVFVTALARQVERVDLQPRFIRYRFWNTKMYPVWRDGDARFKNSWIGGQAKFSVSNDAPTLTGAKITFTIDIHFPETQKVLPDGQVVWAKTFSENGTQHREGEPIYPQQPSEDWDMVFPDGSTLGKDGDKKPPFVFVWKAWGQYWQVSDGPSSSLTIGTDGIPLGSYAMDVVIYHYRKKDKFIPMGYASTQFCITDQIPFEVTLSQVNDINVVDKSFVQNRAVAFTVTLHDPSQYLSTSDVTFNWDFGDHSGTVISRDPTVTHTYTQAGDFRPQVVVQAAIPDPACATPSDSPTGVTVTSRPPHPPVQQMSTGSPGQEPLQSAKVVFSTLVPTQRTMVVSMTTSPSDASGGGDEAEDELMTLSPAEWVTGLADSATTMLVSSTREDNGRHASSTVVDATSAPATNPAPVAVVVAKRHVRDMDDCVIYRYGSYSIKINIVEGIESVEIVQVANAVLMTEPEDNVVDFTITCRGSLPTEVCTIVSDADCVMPVKTICNSVPVSPDCQLVLRQYFNDSGIFCVNVSMTNDVSLAVTSTRVSVKASSKFSSTGTISMVLGVLIVASAVGTVAFTYQRLKGYRPLTEDIPTSQSGSPGWTSFPGLVWSLLSGRMPGESRTLMHRGV